MELWLDTIDFALIKSAAEKLSVAGVTTNPSILSQSGHTPDETLEKLLAIQDGQVAAQVTAQDEAKMLIQAKNLAKLSDRMVIKIPVTAAGLQAIKKLVAEGIKTLATAIFEPAQIYLAALAGAHYAAPYIGRIQLKQLNTQTIVEEMLDIVENMNSSMKIMGAAIHGKQQVMDCLRLRMPAITLSAEAYNELMAEHRQTTAAIDQFEQDWRLTNLEKTQIFV